MDETSNETASEPGAAADAAVDPHRVVVGVDDSDSAAPALRWAMAEAIVRAVPLTALTVAVSPLLYTPLGWGAFEIEESGLLDGARAVLDKAVDHALADGPADPPEITRLTRMGGTTECLVQESGHAALLVVGTRGLRGFTRWLGSVSDQIVRHADCPVAVIPETTALACPPGAPILVGVDGSPNADAALRWAVAEGALRNVPVRAMTAWSLLDQHGVSTNPEFDPDFNGRSARAALQALVERVLGAERAASVELAVECDLPAAGVLAAADEAETPLIVLGARGVGGFRGLLLGSVANRVLVTTNRPVVIVRAPTT